MTSCEVLLELYLCSCLPLQHAVLRGIFLAFSFSKKIFHTFSIFFSTGGKCKILKKRAQLRGRTEKADTVHSETCIRQTAEKVPALSWKQFTQSSGRAPDLPCSQKQHMYSVKCLWVCVCSVVHVCVCTYVHTDFYINTA